MNGDDIKELLQNLSLEELEELVRRVEEAARELQPEPKKTERERKKMVSLRLDPELISEIERVYEELSKRGRIQGKRVTKTGVIEEALRLGLEKLND